MGAFGFAPEVMKPTALALNVLVAAIATLFFRRAGLLTWRSFYPFAVLGFPFSLLGGALSLPAERYYPAVGIVLLLSAALMLRPARRGAERDRDPPFLPALAAGAGIGFVSGVTGTGGGVFLAPIILGFDLGPAAPRRGGHRRLQPAQLRRRPPRRHGDDRPPCRTPCRSGSSPPASVAPSAPGPVAACFRKRSCARCWPSFFSARACVCSSSDYSAVTSE